MNGRPGINWVPHNRPAINEQRIYNLPGARYILPRGRWASKAGEPWYTRNSDAFMLYGRDATSEYVQPAVDGLRAYPANATISHVLAQVGWWPAHKPARAAPGVRSAVEADERTFIVVDRPHRLHARHQKTATLPLATRGFTGNPMLSVDRRSV